MLKLIVLFCLFWGRVPVQHPLTAKDVWKSLPEAAGGLTISNKRITGSWSRILDEWKWGQSFCSGINRMGSSWTQDSFWPTDWSQKVWQSDKLKPGLKHTIVDFFPCHPACSTQFLQCWSLHTLVCNTNIDLTFTLSLWSVSCYTNSR